MLPCVVRCSAPVSLVCGCLINRCSSHSVRFFDMELMLLLLMLLLLHDWLTMNQSARSSKLWHRVFSRMCLFLIMHVCAFG